MNHDDLVRSLIQYVAAGKLDARVVQPALRKLGGGDAPAAASGELLEAVRGLGDPDLGDLAEQLRESRRQDAISVQRLRSRGEPLPEALRESLRDLPLDAPLGWGPRDSAWTLAQAVLRILGDRFFFLPHHEKAPLLAAELERRYQSALDAALQNPAVWGHGTLSRLLAEAGKVWESASEPGKVLDPLREAVERHRAESLEAADRALSTPGEPVPAGLDGDVLLDRAADRLRQAATPEERSRLLDLLCTWPNDRVAPFLASLDLEGREAERATMILSLRFGHAAHKDWEAWRSWVKGQVGLKELSGDGSRVLVRRRPLAMLYLWYSRQPKRDAEQLASLERGVAATLEPVTMPAFIERWAAQISAEEWQALTGESLPRRPDPAPGPKPLRAETRAKAAEDKPSPAKAPQTKPAVPKPPPKPSVWDVHLKPFFLENWYMVAGVLMVLVGSSLLAYYTWDKTPLVRYTLMPALLGAFTVTLARMGGWIERKDAQFRTTAAVLRAAAIALLPVNFMAIALLANESDQVVTRKGLYVPLMGAVYLSAFGWGLRRWCAGVHEKLGLSLAGTLLFLNSLVVVAPLARAISGVNESQLLPVVGTGFYLGFFALAAAVLRFARSTLTLELSKDRRVVWFFGATLAGTFVQVFAWVHGYLKHLPHVYTYAPMVVLTGGLVLFLERRTLELRGEGEKHGAESFLGFAAILLGVLMSVGEPWMRIATFVLAGGVWIACTIGRRHPLHAWIGLTLAALGGAGVALLPEFPKPLMPSLGIALALAMGLFGLLARRSDVLAPAAAGMQAAILLATSIVTISVQVRPGISTASAAAHLAGVAALFGVRAWRDQKIRWAQTAMVILALALPYVAGVDLRHGAYHSTIIVGGLAVLGLVWIGATLAVPSSVLRGARSTVLWIYGALALACMAARATIDSAAGQDLLWLDVGGPLLMAALLVWAAWFSRSLVPSGMAMLITLIMMPPLKQRMVTDYPQLSWGSGLGSSLVAIGFALLAFRLRTHPRLKAVGEGDKYMGLTPYPFQRADATLFTWPLLASAFFLIAKVETWNFITNLDQGIKLPTAEALVASGIGWLLLAAYYRGRPGARAASYIGLLWGSVGAMFCCARIVANPEPAIVVLWAGLFLQGLFFLFRFGLEPRARWAADLLTQPARRLLRLGSLLVSVGLIAGYVLDSKPEGALAVLTSFVTLQLIWHGLASRHLKYGFQLYLLNWSVLVAGTIRHLDSAVLPTLAMAIGVQALQGALEFRRPVYDFLKPLMRPFQGLASGISFLLGIVILCAAVDGRNFAVVECWACLIALALSARALNAGPVALMAALVGYVLVAGVPSPSQGVLVLLEPRHVSCFALVLAVLADAGRRVHSKFPRVLAGPFKPSWVAWPALPWVQVPAVALPFVGAAVQIAQPEWRDVATHSWAPYAGAAAVALMAYSMDLLPLYSGAGALLSLGNIHVLRTLAGGLQSKLGLSEIHLLCLGVAIALLQGSLIRRFVRRDEIVRLIHRTSVAGAALILLLLSANYLVHPDLAAIKSTRFAISGVMAFLAGWYFRRVAREPAPGEEALSVVGEGFYHFGVTMAFWCGALTIPALRTPVTALIALGLPVLYFYARAESGFRRSTETYERYRVSAATLGFVVLALYALHGFVRMAIFPDSPFDTNYYHANAPVILVLGLVLLRLRALGGTEWLAFYGGLAVMGASYLALTAWPGLSPFQNPVPSAWAALAVAHFFTAASLQRSPLRTGIQRLAGVDAQEWQALRRPWGVCLLVAAHGLVLWGCLDHVAQPKMVGPLIVGAASLLVHQGILRQSRVYPILAQIELAAALHAGFVVHSYLAPIHVVWAILALWAALLLLQPAISRLVPGWKIDIHAATLAGLTALHVAYHGPGSVAGLWAFALGAVLLALTPMATRTPERPVESLAAALLTAAPAWLVWFSQGRGVIDLGNAWPALATIATLFATGVLGSFLHRGGTELYLKSARLRPRLYDQTICWMGVHGSTLQSILLWTTAALTALVQALHWGKVFEPREVAAVEALYAGIGVAAFMEGRFRRSMAPFFLLEVCALAAYLVGRQQFLLTRGLWTAEYDVWASLAAFFGVVGLKQVLEGRPRELMVPVTSALLALPAFSVAWMTLHHLNTNLELTVIGLHSAAFAYLGRDDRESPYHFVAVGGFVGFVLLLFGASLHLTTAYAFVIPVGVGVLVLLQLFRSRVAPDARNAVRTVVLVAMIGSAGVSALLDAKVPLVHNLVVILLCLGAMALGGFLRIRLYAALGFGALTLDLVVIFVKAVALLERTARMTIVGSSVLALGALLVFGAIYYKTHRAEIGERLDRWRLRFTGWE